LSFYFNAFLVVLDSINYDELSELNDLPPQSITNPLSTVVSPLDSSNEILSPLVNACVEIHIDAKRITTVHTQTTGSSITVGPGQFRIFLKNIRSVTRKLRAESTAKFYKIKFIIFIFCRCTRLEKAVMRVAEVAAEIPRLEHRLELLLPLLEEAAKNVEEVMEKIHEESEKV
jgi:hypothetical protein